MKKYTEPAVKRISLDSEDIMDMTISNTVGDEGQFLNEGLFDELDDELYDDVRIEETQARSTNLIHLNVWEN